jgi:hypothetical protein
MTALTTLSSVLMSAVSSTSFISGVISGIVASLMFFLALLLVRPRITISENICRGTDGKYRVKVVNHSRAMLKNPRYLLESHTPRPGGNFDAKPIEACRKDSVLFIDKYDRRDSNASYAVIFSYEIPDALLSSETCDFEFVFIAEHAFSNTTVCKKRKYTCSDFVDGSFKSGKTTTIARSERQQAFSS